MIRYLLVLCASALSALGCHGPTGPATSGGARDESPIQTDSLVYHLVASPGAHEATAVATYVNRTGAPVYYARCGVGQYTGPLFGYRRTGTDSTRSLFTDSAWACVGGVPTGELLPGGSLTVRVRLGSFDQLRMTPPLRPEQIVGRMRIEFSLCTRYSADSDYCDPVQQSARQSNAFDVEY